MTASISSILDEMNESNGGNHKLAVLQKHKDNDLLARVFKMTHDTVLYRYYMSLNHWHKNGIIHESNVNPTKTLEDALDFMEFKLATRELTGNAALDAMDAILRELSDTDRDVIMKIINRDLRINCGRTQINKVFPKLISKMVYMRCGVFNTKSAKDISFPAFIQLKADGTYRELQVSESGCALFSRSGERYEYDGWEKKFTDLPYGHYTGELLIQLTPENIGVIKEMYPDKAQEFETMIKEGKKYLPRSISNGIINSMGHM